MENKSTSEELLKNSKIFIQDTGMEMVPYSIALQALLLEKTLGFQNSLEKQLDQFNKIESELKTLFK